MAKRGQNEGSVTYRKRDRRWQVAVTIDGKRTYRYTAPGAPKKAAEPLLAELLRLRDAGVEVPADRLTLEAYLLRWLADMKAGRRRIRAATYRHYEKIARIHIIPALGQLTLDKVTTRRVQLWLDADTSAPQTVSHHRAVLRRALNVAVAQGIIPRNPALNVELPAITTAERPVLTVEQARHLLEVTGDRVVDGKPVKADRYHPIWVLALTTGLRESELLGLAWEDIDFKAGTMRVGWQTARVETGEVDDKGKPILDWGRVAPKTAGSIATIPVPAIALEALKAHQLRQAAARKPSWRFWGLVFTTERGEPIHGNVVLTAWYRALAKAGLSAIHLHDARHTCASILMAAGLDMDVIQKILRHSNARMTKHYAHVLPSLSREAADHMDRALGGAR